MKRKHGYYDDFVRTCAKYPAGIAMRVYNNQDYKVYTYSELYGVCEYIAQNVQQVSCSKGTIGLVTVRNAIIPSLIAASHRCSTSFMFIAPSQDVQAIIKKARLSLIIHVKDLKQNTPNLLSSEPDKKIIVFDLEISIYNLQPQEFQGSHNCNTKHSFIAMSSGSTGEARYISVPLTCIQPNVDDLTKLFQISRDDVIYFSTPLTFDPSMVEILLACINGASLLVAPERADVLFPENTENSVTFWQTTPSKFFQYSTSEIKNRILSARSTLKVLALGGEPLNGIRRLKELKNVNNNTKLFTLYGVTELSCWACVAELDLSTVSDDREIPLGTCLSETQIFVQKPNASSDTGNIILASETRKCTILNQTSDKQNNSEQTIDTGDIGEKRNGIVYYRGRKDDMVKRFGHKISLHKIEATVMQCPRVRSCSCVWLPKPMLLVVYFCSDTLNASELKIFLKCKLDDRQWPDKIIRAQSLPTNCHGKTSKRMLSQIFEKSALSTRKLNSTRAVLMSELKTLFNKPLTYDEICDQDFFSLGGTSFFAIAMCNKISVTYPELGKHMLPYLVNPSYTINQIMETVSKEMVKEKRAAKRLRLCTPSESSAASVRDAPARAVPFEVVWAHDTGKCVDATPTLFRDELKVFVSVGSHSGNIIVVEALSGRLRGSLVAGSRIEAAVARSEQPTRGLVGTHDGTVLCFALRPCAEVWRGSTGAVIKSKGVVCAGGFYVASYDGRIRNFDVLTGEIKDTIFISDAAISADLVLAKKEFLLVATLSGICTCVHLVTKSVMWRTALGSPVFANPALYNNDEYAVFAEVGGTVHCCSVDAGVKLWEYQGAKGNIFSSMHFRRLDRRTWAMVFGCHDSHVYGVAVADVHRPRLLWQTQLRAPVYATPCRLGEHVVAAASNGDVCVLSAADGALLTQYHLPSEVFSSPKVYSDVIFVGCRDDSLYSLKCHVP